MISRRPLSAHLSTSGSAAMLAAIVWLGFASGAGAELQTLSNEGAAACLKCHEHEIVLGILETPHAEASDPKSPAAREQCESCHGPSARHMEFPMQIGNIRFTKESTTPPEQQNESCLACHEDGERMDWKTGAHGFDKIACATCHTIHNSSDPILLRSHQVQSCTESCHESVLGEEQKRSPHPIVDDVEITCIDCHNPHCPVTSARCSSCHEQTPEEFAKESKKARDFHVTAKAKKIDCMRCHKGLAHAMPAGAVEGAAESTAPQP